MGANHFDRKLYPVAGISVKTSAPASGPNFCAKKNFINGRIFASLTGSFMSMSLAHCFHCEREVVFAVPNEKQNEISL